MILIQLSGYAAFIIASLVLGTRLVLLWRRTRELPELTIGLAFWFAGCMGYTAWMILGVLLTSGAPPEQIKLVAVAGLGVTLIGAFFNGLGTMLVFRKGVPWAKAFVALVGFSMLASWGTYVVSPVGASTAMFWMTVVMAAPFYLWGAVESLMLSGVLRKRARLGLADPMVADRSMQFGICSGAVVVGIFISYTAQLVYGAAPPVWTATLASLSLLVGAGAIWLGFFPPASHRARVEHSLGGN